jgi:hypothetical protein
MEVNSSRGLQLIPCSVTPHEIWIQHDLGFRFAYLEEKREAVEEAEGLHLGLLSSRDGLSWAPVQQI